eukprot:TRINITY_DN28387_c0_g1_i1.p1 TRINITY_DN28387_c0_g1~~TRINITY_DN28387_c0_g1_i1.p1  ORF type:complete len:563 (-),score=140.25 TRINITY_DN28387_c0_g1_i1:262-1950(-)
MASVGAFVEALRDAFLHAGVDGEECSFDEASGHLVIVGRTTRVVPVAALYPRYAACRDSADQRALIDATTEAFVDGRADVPEGYAECGQRLLPQLWPLEKIRGRQMTLPVGHQLPHCGMHGEEAPLESRAGLEKHTFGVVLVCEYLPDGSTLPPLETPVLSSDLARWGVGFHEALQRALENLRLRTKAGPGPEKRWEHHPSGCGQTTQCDRFDAARMALFPTLVVKRKRPDGLPEEGGHVVAFATASCALATTSKNALGLCFLGDTLHLTIAAKTPQQILSTVPYRLLKMKDSSLSEEAKKHPLAQKVGEGFVWRWVPYSPGGPPTRSPGEFSVPVDQGEVDAILHAAEGGKSIPVFDHADSVSSKEASARFMAKKDEGNQFFKSGEFVKAIAAYDAALKPGAPSNADASIVHSNAAQALLKLAAADVPRREACAAEAMRRAVQATELDPNNAKAHARLAAACEILGEAAAAAEAQAKAEACLAKQASADSAAKAAKAAEAEKKRKEKEEREAAAEKARLEREHREALLAREIALEREKEEADASDKLQSMLGVPSIAGYAR